MSAKRKITSVAGLSTLDTFLLLLDSLAQSGQELTRPDFCRILGKSPQMVYKYLTWGVQAGFLTYSKIEGEPRATYSLAVKRFAMFALIAGKRRPGTKKHLP